MRRQYRSMDNSSGVGVLDKAAIVLGALEAGPASLATLVAATAIPAGADPTTATFQLTAGGLSISVPASVSIGSQLVSSSATTIR